jgi:hypothetical protein
MRIPLIALAGVALTALQFWYGTQYVPSIASPFLTVQGQLDRVSTSAKDQLPLSVKMTVRNTSRKQGSAGSFAV